MGVNITVTWRLVSLKSQVENLHPPYFLSKSFPAAWLIHFMNEPHHKCICLRLCSGWNDYTSERVRLVINWGDAATPSRRQPTYSAEELHLALRLTQILKMKIHAQREHSRRSVTFLCRPLNTTAKAPCPTRSFLLYSKSPTVSIATGWWSRTDGRLRDVALLLKDVCNLSAESWGMLHLVLPIYFMVSWYVSYCIKKKGCG